MVALVARQSVILKCNMQASVMLGNYEFYYGAGLFCKINGIGMEEAPFAEEEIIRPEALREFILPKLKAFGTEDEKERYLVKLLLNYAPSEEYDVQMKELFLWGLKEEKLWIVN